LRINEWKYKQWVTF